MASQPQLSVEEMKLQMRQKISALKKVAGEFVDEAEGLARQARQSSSSILAQRPPTPALKKKVDPRVEPDDDDDDESGERSLTGKFAAIRSAAAIRPDLK